ncbi:hypothetical protein AcV5_002212 [Taiwanofungus camphoratus]|nr:hypothetical protein AcV5_002212 [Antrodia cinnamomea]
MSMVRIWAKQLEMNPLDICGYLLSENAYWTSGHESHGCASTSNYSLSLEPEEYSLPVVSYSGICGDSPPAWYPLVKQPEEAIFSCPPPEVVIQQHLRANSFLPDIIPGAGPETCTPRDLLHVERQLNQYGEQCTIMRMEQGNSNAYWQWNAIDSENHTIHEHI